MFNIAVLAVYSDYFDDNDSLEELLVGMNIDLVFRTLNYLIKNTHNDELISVKFLKTFFSDHNSPTYNAILSKTVNIELGKTSED